MLTLSAISLIETPSDFSKMILMLQDEKGNFKYIVVFLVVFIVIFFLFYSGYIELYYNNQR